MTTEPNDEPVADETTAARMMDAEGEVSETDDVEGHRRLSQFLDTDPGWYDPYQSRPSGAPER